ncbi:MAG: methionyl-tRNA formyltransferase [Bacteroidota bacterium]
MARIVFFGTPGFAVPSLEVLVEYGHEIAAVVTAPDKPAGRGLKLKFSPIKELALSLNIPVLQPIKLSEQSFIDSLKSINAELFIVVAFRMLPESVWNMPPLGTYNVHSSLLPNYRGAAPINRAIMDGCNNTGVTTFKLRHEIDTGGIILQQETIIGTDETAGELHDRLMMMGADILIKTVELVTSGTANPIPQEQLILESTTLASAPKLFSSDCQLHWENSAIQLHNQIRGLSPFPGAFTHLVHENGLQQVVKMYRSKLHLDIISNKPGCIHIADGKLMVQTGTTAIEILELQLEGKKRMATTDFLRGNNIKGCILR